MTHKAFHQREIEHLQEQNARIVAQVEVAEQERDQAHQQIAACEERDASLQNEVQGVRDKISALGAKLQQDKAETVAKDEHVRVLGEQNTQMLTLLEQEETKSKGHLQRIQDLEKKNKKLQRIAEQFDAAKAELEEKVAEAKRRCADIVADVRGQRSVNENLRANIQNTEARTRVDIEALGQALQVVDAKNLEYLNRINKQETREQQLQAETNSLQEQVEQVRMDIDQLRKQLEGDEEGRGMFERARSQIELTIEGLEVQADTLKKALSTAERANEQMQEENRTSADRCRETADKVYALMDSLRLNQVELKKLEAENGIKDKKMLSLERQTQNLQAKISMECDAKVLAEQERKEAEQEAVVLKKKNKKIEEAVTAAQQAQERAEKEIAEYSDKVSSAQTQNAYLASRIDGQEEEKSALKSEIKKMADRSAHLVAENTQVRDEIDRFEEEAAAAHADLEALRRELEYIKREDVLDDAGRQRPILIQSNDSDLVEKLQINEFLYEAQQARNPVPPMIEKIAQLLALLHEGQGRADAYLADLSKSNGLVSALRQRNMALFSKTQMFESFKTRALMRYVMNLIEGEHTNNLHLDGLSFGIREINEMLQMLPRYEAHDSIFTITLIDNALDDEAVNLLVQIVYALPYLRRLDIRRNCISPEGVKRIEDQLKIMEGITGVIKTAEGALNVHSGNQLRLVVDVGEQMPKEHVAREVDFTVDQTLTHQDADPFLATNSGTSRHPWTQSAAAAATTQRAPHKAVPEPTSVELSKPSGAPQPPAVGGPPVGLGGPGNVASLNSKKRQAKRAKQGPPPALDSYPVAEKWQVDDFLRPPLSRKGSVDLGGAKRQPARAPSSDRKTLGHSTSMPALPPQRHSANPPPLGYRRPGGDRRPSRR